jgi:amino acid adenylation domain-containing protein
MNRDTSGQPAAVTAATAATAVGAGSAALLSAIWCEVFEVAAVSPADNFFALGGDSLAAAQIAARVEEVFGIELPIDALLSTPVLADLAALVAALAPPGDPAGAPASVARHAGGAGDAVAPPLGSIPRPRAVPLSFAQRRLWFLHQLDPQNPVHNIAALLRLGGPLDLASLARSLAAIVERHEALRTVFRATGSEPTQEAAAAAPAAATAPDAAAGAGIANPAAGLALPAIDLTALRSPVREREMARVAASIARLPFGLEDGMLLRVAVIRGRPDDHGLVLVWHHIAADGWSLGVFLRELRAGYEALHAGRPLPLAALPLQYADFALWQRRWLRDEALAARLAFWRETLQGAPPALDLPADRPRPAVLSHRGAHHERRLPADLTAALRAVAHESRATMFMALLCGFAALLSRLTGAEDLVLGTPISGRHRRELEELIGVFINNIVLRIDAAGDPSFRQLLGRVRQAALAAYAQQDLPFEALVDALGGERDLSRTPLFQVLFVEQSAPLGRVAMADLTVEPREIDLGTARFDLALAVAPVDAGWLETWKYSTDLFDAPTPMRLAGHLEALLAAAAAAPDLPLSRLAWFPAAERHQVLLAWNDTATAYPEAGRCLHQLIAAQAARTPEAVAVLALAAPLAPAGVELTYAELARRAGRLARHLERLGVGPESLVGVAAERSADMIVGLLAVLAAGGAYVPLDPGYPGERLALMLADAQVGVLLTQSHLLTGLPPHRARVVLLDRLDESDGRDVRPGTGAGGATRAHPDNPAYVIYTSGSTGRPKGVAVSHRGIVNRLLWMQAEYRLAADDRVLQKTPYSFDVSVWELFWPLMVGARLVVAPPAAHQDPAWLARIIRDAGITTLHFVPSMLQAFLAGTDLRQACRSVRRVIASGEALPYELQERAHEQIGAPLHNLYGPTEAAVDVSFHACAPGGARRPVPIGRPIANIALHVIDRRGELVPSGVPGELMIGGVGVARGYLRAPDLTAARFVPDAWGEAGGRLYRTGDLARFRPDGAIEFLGRLDHQVKVRGVRIELGEIEAALLRHPRLREAVVMLGTPAGGGEPRLAAYLVAAGPPPSAGELRRFLAERLPDAMLPAAWVMLPALPLTPSGKADRRALAAAGAAAAADTAATAAAGDAGDASDGAAAAGRPWAAPRTPLELRLAELWAELLRVERIGVDDSFFELGGDSIQGAMFINRMQAELGEILYVMALFDAPTVASFAAYLERAYPAAAARMGGAGGAPGAAAGPAEEVAAALAAVHAAAVRRLGRDAAATATAGGHGAVRQGAGPRQDKVPRAVFILAPFRSGTTLLRVMLAGHSRLFAPPELELLGFRTLAERGRAYSGRNAFALEGLLRAVMELRGCDAGEARAWVAECEQSAMPTADLYRRLQEESGGRLLVDKTPSYALDVETLRRAEEMFDRPHYLHLVRHPRATIDSYLEAHMDQVYDFPFAPPVQAELVWLLCHRNIVDFLSAVPAERVHRLRFEELVKTPRATMEALSRFLALPFEEALLEPYQGRRMADGLHAESRMMGDPKFHRHRGIAAEVADRHQRRRTPQPAPLALPASPAAESELLAETWEVAARLGYVAPAADGLLAAAAAPLAPSAARRAAGEALPLSYAQERLWFLAQLDPASPAYNMPATILMDGALDSASLARSFDEVRRRHEVLRTTFPAAGGKPALAVSADFVAALPAVDLGALPEERRRPEMERLVLAEGRRPFDLSHGPLLRTLLVALGGDRHALLVTMHHIVSDGWTIGILTRELAAHYGFFARGLPAALPELPLQYADYAAWQRQWLDDGAVAAHLDYWRRRLAGWLPPLGWPTDRPRPAHQTFRGARVSRTLAAVPAAGLREASRRQGTTLFLTLLAAWSALAARHTAQDDLLMGIPIANRNRVEVEDLIGFFLNMVVARNDAAGDPTLRELLRRVSDGFLGSVPHQEVPFEKLVEALHLPRDRSRAPVFQMQFSLQNTPPAPLALPGLTLEMAEIHNRTTKFDFTVFLFDRANGLTTTLEYNTDLFDAATMERLLGAWETLLAAVPDAADQRLSDLPLLTAAERAHLLAPWRLTALPAPTPGTPGPPPEAGACLHRLFEEQARRRPRAVAVVHELEELTYDQLNRRANRLARRLRALGVGPRTETPVGLLVERSVPMLVGLLGILKAGGAYLPLDPAYPRERLVYTLQDALAGTRAPVLVTEERLAGLLGEELVLPVVRLDSDRDRDLLAACSDQDLEDGPLPQNLAYVIYTSGSTGRPKGVPVTHANVARLLAATAHWFGFGPDDVWTMAHSVAFDFSVWEIWGALAHGGRLVIVPRDATLSPAAFADLLTSEKVTVLNQTPSAFRQLAQLAAAEGSRIPSLRWVIFGGEALELAALAPWLALHGEAAPRLINMYGITETTVHVTYRPIGLRDLARPGHGPLGEPIPDLTVRLLGRHGELVPLGVPGEIHVGGAGVARGYLGRPDLTARRFVPDAWGGEPGARLYASGDLARRLPDGDMEYLGRIDHQVKIRGFRIELGEIEAVLRAHPGVAEAVVMLRQEEGGDRRLAAHFVSRDAAAVTSGELRSHLRSLLPEHMVPAAFVALAAMPLTPGGKIDRRALPSGDAAGEAAPAAHAAPRTPTERWLAQVWLEVLRIEQLGRDDNFFDLGGHSLLVTQVVSRIQAACGVALPMASVFDAPTLADLAARIDALRPPEAAGEEPAAVAAAVAAAGGGLPGIPRAARDRPLPPSFAQERLWFLDQLQPGSPFYNVPISLRLRGRLNVAALAAAWSEIARRHETLRTSFASAHGQPVQVVAPAAAVSIPLVDLATLGAVAEATVPGGGREAVLSELAHQEARQPFDLARPPLLRLRLIRMGAEDHALLATVHHIVSDGWSMGVLIREVAALYTAFCESRPSPLPELAIQYADFAAWQRGWLQGERLDEELDFWRRQLDGAPQVIELPADHPRPPVAGFAGRHLRFTWPAELTSRARALARRTGTTFFMTLLAALEVQIHRYTGLGDFLVGSPVANRNRREVEDLIGFFVNTLVLRARLQGEQSVAELLAGVRATTLAAFGRQDLPFEKLVQHPAVSRDASRSPLFQVFLVLQNAPAEALSLPGLTLEALETESGAAKFDLTLSATETAEGLAGFLEYSTELFEPATAARILGHCRNLLEGMTEGDGTRLCDLPLLGGDERRQLLAAWSGGPAEPPAMPFHRLFERQVRAMPAATTAMASDGTVLLTYLDLNRRANQVAHRLRRLGIGPEARVAIALPRSPAALVSIVGTLKTGAAYVPLDPSHPPERLALIVEDTAPTLLLTDVRSRGELRLPDGCRVIHLEGAWDEGGAFAAEPDGDLPPGSGDDFPESPAYAIFTSGTTGRPKGVPISHRALANFLLAMEQRPGLAADDVVAATATISFDIHTLELLLPLIVGARIELLSREEAMDGALLAARLASSQATLYQATPSGWRILLDAGWEGSPRLKALCGGEVLTPELAARLLPRVGSLWNIYGPTETTVWSVVERVKPDPAAAAPVPIGRPIPNFTLYILDRYLEPVPAGVVGELCIAGLGLSRGYFVSPDLTAGRFLPHPFGERGARIYRTGDLVRQRSGGAIEFQGRADHQVKIRGFRIEPDEVAAVLAKHPAVRKAVVMARPVAGGELGLVAYLVAGDPPPAIADLRDFLKERLPAYMVPADFVMLESFPLAPTGKIDRRALPAPATVATPGQGYAAAETPTEELLVAIWEQILDRSPVGVHDNFFALGGHSLLAPRVIAHIDATFQVRLPLRTFFASPTIAGVATSIDLILLQEIEALTEEEAEIAAPDGVVPAVEGSWR